MGNALRYCLQFLVVFLAVPLHGQAEEIVPATNSIAVNTSVLEAVRKLDNAHQETSLIGVVVESSVKPGATTTTASTEGRRIAPNVWHMRSFIKTKSGGIESNSYTLCGLVDLLSSIRSSINLDMSIPVGVGRLAVPGNVMSLPIGHETSAVARVSELVIQNGSESICKPSADEKFAFDISVEHESTRKSTILWTSESKVAIASHWDCSTEKEKPLSQITNALEGNFLPVQCTIKNTKTSAIEESSFAFIKSAGIYLQLEAKKGRTTFSHKPLSITHE